MSILQDVDAEVKAALRNFGYISHGEAQTVLGKISADIAAGVTVLNGWAHGKTHSVDEALSVGTDPVSAPPLKVVVDNARPVGADVAAAYEKLRIAAYNVLEFASGVPNAWTDELREALLGPKAPASPADAIQPVAATDAPDLPANAPPAPPPLTDPPAAA